LDPAVRFRATTTVDIYRGSTTNDYLDEVDTDTTPVYRAVPASLIPRSRRQKTPGTDEIRIVHTVACRLPSNRTVLKGDRVKDTRTGRSYVIEQIDEPPADPGFTRDLSLTLGYTD
jgi:sulfur carrier protein ThiS